MSILADIGSPLSETDRRIAAQLKARREALGLSLNEIAARSAVSRAMISKIERCDSSPTAALLGRLCNGLGITLSSLMVNAERPAAPLLRAAEQPVWRDPATGLVRTAVSPPGTKSPVELVRVELPPGATVAYEPQRRLDYEQHVLILEGALALTIGAEDFRLAAGDCLYMRPNRPLRFSNEATGPCRYLVVLMKSVA